MRRITGSDDHEPPSAAQFEVWNRRMSAPENEAPAGLPFSAVLGRTDETAVCVTGFRVYSTGLAFTLSVRLRSEPRNRFRHRIHELLSGHGPGDPDGNLDERLLLGVEYADGRTATNLTSDWPPRFEQGAVEPDEPLLRMGGGGGGGRTYDHDFWLSPLPPAGPLTFVCRWPSFGITESQTELDATQVVAARERVQTLWPWEPAADYELEPEPVEPQLPSDGWFAGALRRPRDR
jgi:hypothetical protein